MSSRLSDRLSAERRRIFVGRENERNLFEGLLRADELPFPVLYVFGPGGVGKTTLLRAFADQCAQANVPALRLDAREVEPTPEGWNMALCQALGLTGAETPADALANRTWRQVIFVDTYEMLMPLDEWLREVFLPQMPERLLLVLAGR